MFNELTINIMIIVMNGDSFMSAKPDYITVLYIIYITY